MKTRMIPRTDLNASVLCLGTAEFGSAINDSEAEAILDRYVGSGGNVLDTAEVYAAWLVDGRHRSEEFLGTWLHRRKNRDNLIISTKGAHPRLASMHLGRMSKEEVEFDLESSLMRLRIDCADLYWLHRDDPSRSTDEIVAMLKDFQQAGKIRYAGLSNWTLERAESARVSAEKLGFTGIIGTQNQLSLAEADAAKGDPTWAYIDEAFVQWHVRHGFAAFAYTPQANGYFRRLAQGSIDQASELVKGLFHHPENQRRYERSKALQNKTGFTQAQVVLGYLLGQPFPVYPILGPKKVADLEESLQAGGVSLDPDQVNFLAGNQS